MHEYVRELEKFSKYKTQDPSGRNQKEPQCKQWVGYRDGGKASTLDTVIGKMTEK